MRFPNGFGTVYKLPGNRRKPWIARKTAERKKGEPTKYLTIGYYETREEALEDLIAYNKKPIGKVRNKTLQELYDGWSKRHYRDLSKSMENGYKAGWKRMKVLAEEEVRDLRKSHLQDIVEEMIDNGLSRSSMEKYKTLAVLLWDEAMASDIVDKNYGSLITLPKARQTKKPIFTDLEVKTIEKLAAEGDLWAQTVAILLYTGMRVGELLKLTRFNVDLENWVITGGIKTDAGTDRPVPIHDKIKGYIKSWYDTKGPRLIHRDGNVISVDYYRASIFYPLLDRAEIERGKRTPHSTRHTFATMLDRAKVNTKHIQDLMGHSDYATTANTYTHPEIEELRKAINAI